MLQLVLLPIEQISLNSGQIKGLPKNPRFIKDKDFKNLVESIREYPEMLSMRECLVYPFMALESLPPKISYVVIGGNMRLRACLELGFTEIPCKVLPEATPLDRLKAYVVKDNGSAGSWDFDMLADEWGDLPLDKWGVSLPDAWLSDSSGEGDGDGPTEGKEGSLAERFVVPPFSVLDTRQGYWQERKAIWRQRIGDNGESRTGTLRKSASGDDPGYYRQKEKAEKAVGRALSKEEFEADHYQRRTTLPAGVSLLDPVLSEIVVQWFGLKNGSAFDPFAGDSVFGFVSVALGMRFTGIELRPEQAALNQQRIDEEGLPGTYICDDGRNVANHLSPESQDLLFSCPPYFDLEVYSDDAKDASNQKTYEGFYDILHHAFLSAATRLKPNRFAVIVVGDVRNKKTGAYYGFPQDIINTMQTAGLHFYNECILIEQSGNAAIRAANQMKHRKVVKTHQQVLVFYKGDPRQIKTHFPEIAYEAQDLESFGMDSPDAAEPFAE